MLLVFVLLPCGALAELVSDPDPGEVEQGETVAPIGNYSSVDPTGSPTQEFYVQLWSYKKSLVGLLAYEDIKRRSSLGDLRGASGGLLKDVSYDAGSGKLSFRATFAKACVRKKLSPCQSPHVIVSFRGVLKNGPAEDVVRGRLEIHDRATKDNLFKDAVTLVDPRGGSYSRYESYDKWLTDMKKIIHYRGGVLE